MKKQILILNVVIIFLLAASAAMAQSVKSVKADIAFDFRVGDKTYPAGEYLIESVSRGSDNLLRVKGAGKNQLIIANFVNAGKRLPQPKLIFRRAGNEYYLAQVFLEPGAWGFSVPNSPKYSNGEKNLAAAPPAAVKVKAKN